MLKVAIVGLSNRWRGHACQPVNPPKEDRLAVHSSYFDIVSMQYGLKVCTGGR